MLMPLFLHMYVQYIVSIRICIFFVGYIELSDPFYGLASLFFLPFLIFAYADHIYRQAMQTQPRCKQRQDNGQDPWGLARGEESQLEHRRRTVRWYVLHRASYLTSVRVSIPGFALRKERWLDLRILCLVTCDQKR